MQPGNETCRSPESDDFSYAKVVAVLVCLFALGSPGALLAQAPPLSIDLATMSLPVRSDAPITVFFKIRSQSANLIEGRLEVSIHDGLDPLAQIELDGLVISAGDQIVRMVLPPIESNNPQGEVRLKVTFVGKNFRISPDAFALRAVGQWQRAFVVLIPDAMQRLLNRDTQQLFDRMRFETWNANKSDRTVFTYPAHARPEELPADPLGYCGFDVAILADEGFSELKESQLRALFDWVASGGSVCVVPGESALKEYHVRLLNQAAQADDDAGPFSLDAEGRIPRPEDEAESQRPLLLRHGLGRVAVVRGRLDALLDRTAQLREMLAFLWKLRRDRLEEFVAKGTFLIADEDPSADQAQGPYQMAQQAQMRAQMQVQNAQDKLTAAQAELAKAQAANAQADIEQAQAQVTQAQADLAQAQTQVYVNSRNVNYASFRPRENQLAQLPLKSGDQLVSRLMPQGLKFVPMSLIGLILAVYVLLIGPGDWFILGAIRRRKWTWFTFPAVTITLTLATVWLAEWYMQIDDNRRTVTLHDVAADGRTIRRNRFEVLFLGAEKEVQTELSREIFCPMSLRRFSDAIGYSLPQQMQDESKLLRPGVARYAGRLPTNYTVGQFLTQWTPQLNRRFAITLSEKPAVDFDWNAFADSKIYNYAALMTGTTANGLLEKVRHAFGPLANVAILSQGKRHNLAGAFQFLQGTDVYGVDANGNQFAANRYYYGYNPNSGTTNFLNDVSVNSLGGLFAVVSQISPNGGKDFEDMALLDPSDPEQWLLVIAVDRGNSVDIYRKLYVGGR